MNGDSMILMSNAIGLLALVLAVALSVALLEWLIWRGARLAGLPVPAAGGFTSWIAGLGGLATAPPRQGEPPTVSLGYSIVVASVLFPAALLAHAAAGQEPSGGLGVIGFAPLLTALGYALASERALSVEATRHRMAIAGRILFATPAWAISVAAWASSSGAIDPAAAAQSDLAPWWRTILALALVWSGQFILPGTAGELELSARPWGGDAREASRAVRMATALAHYAGLATVCGVAGSAFGGHFGSAGWFVGVLAALAVAFALRILSTLSAVGTLVRVIPRWTVPVVLLTAIWVGFQRVGGLP